MSEALASSNHQDWKWVVNSDIVDLFVDFDSLFSLLLYSLQKTFLEIGIHFYSYSLAYHAHLNSLIIQVNMPKEYASHIRLRHLYTRRVTYIILVLPLLVTIFVECVLEYVYSMSQIRVYCIDVSNHKYY